MTNRIAHPATSRRAWPRGLSVRECRDVKNSRVNPPITTAVGNQADIFPFAVHVRKTACRVPPPVDLGLKLGDSVRQLTASGSQLGDLHRHVGQVAVQIQRLTAGQAEHHALIRLAAENLIRQTAPKRRDASSALRVHLLHFLSKNDAISSAKKMISIAIT